MIRNPLTEVLEDSPPRVRSILITEKTQQNGRVGYLCKDLIYRLSFPRVIIQAGDSLMRPYVFGLVKDNRIVFPLPNLYSLQGNVCLGSVSSETAVKILNKEVSPVEAYWNTAFAVVNIANQNRPPYLNRGGVLDEWKAMSRDNPSGYDDYPWAEWSTRLHGRLDLYPPWEVPRPPGV